MGIDRSSVTMVGYDFSDNDNLSKTLYELDVDEYDFYANGIDETKNVRFISGMQTLHFGYVISELKEFKDGAVEISIEEIQKFIDIVKNNIPDFVKPFIKEKEIKIINFIWCT